MNESAFRDVAVAFRLTPEQHRWLTEAADREGISTSQLIRKAVGIYIFGATGPFEVAVEPKPVLVKCDRPHNEVCTRPHKRRRRVPQTDPSAAPGLAIL